MRSLLTLLTVTSLLVLAGCSDSEPAKTPTPESVEAAPPAVAEAEAEAPAVEKPAAAATDAEAAPEAAGAVDAAEPAAAAAAAASGAYVGSVMYEDEAAVGQSKPLAGAAISQHGVATGGTTTSDAKGVFSLALVDTENPAILVSAEGYVSSLTTFSKARSSEGNEPIMLFNHADEQAISTEDYGVKYNPELGGVVLSFQAVGGDDAQLAGLAASIAAKNGGEQRGGEAGAERRPKGQGEKRRRRCSGGERCP